MQKYSLSIQIGGFSSRFADTAWCLPSETVKKIEIVFDINDYRKAQNNRTTFSEFYKMHKQRS
jgi:hypothetical protein